MTVFILASTGLALLCLCALLFGLFRIRNVRQVNLDSVNLSIARERLSELESSDDTDSDGTPEVEASLLTDLSGPGYLIDDNFRHGRRIALALLLLTPVSAGLIYYQIGDTRWTEHSAAQLSQADSQGEVNVEELLMKLERSLEENPENADGWAIAGRTYMVMNQFEKAEKAYARVHSLVGDDPDILTAWADASLMRNGGVFTDSIAARIRRALELDPVQLNALWIGALGARSVGDDLTAITYVERLRPLLADNPEALIQLDSLLPDRFRGSTTENGETELSGVTGSEIEGDKETANIVLQVSIAPELMRKLDSSTPVFVIARAIQDSPIPLAVRRIAVGDLPQTIRLNDDDSMIDGNSLSHHERVLLVARVSLSGSPSAQSGDLTSDVIEVGIPGEVPLVLEVNRRIP